MSKKVNTSSNSCEMDHEEKIRKFLTEDKDLLAAIDLIKKSANSGNSASQTLLATYNYFVGSNVPALKTTAFSEALKWSYMNRNDISNKIISAILNVHYVNQMPGFPFNQPIYPQPQTPWTPPLSPTCQTPFQNMYAPPQHMKPEDKA